MSLEGEVLGQCTRQCPISAVVSPAIQEWQSLLCQNLPIFLFLPHGIFLKEALCPIEAPWCELSHTSTTAVFMSTWVK